MKFEHGRTARIEQALAKAVMKLQPVEALPQIAAEALVTGLDSPSLRILAGSNSTDPPAELWELFTKSARELGLSAPDEIAAARLLLRFYIKDIAEGQIAPARGVERILTDIYHPVGRKLTEKYAGDGLGIESLLGDYYAYDDAWSGRLEFEGRRLTKEEAWQILDQSITDEARRILAETDSGAAT